jgi:hypothetical protein
MKVTAKQSLHDAAEVTVSISELRVRCVALIDLLAEGKLRRVVVTKRNQPVGEMLPPDPGRFVR